MGMGISIFLFAVGAILTWAVNVQSPGIDLNVVGVILMVVSGLGFFASLFLWSEWGPFGTNTERTIIREHEVYGDVVDEPHTHRHRRMSA